MKRVLLVMIVMLISGCSGLGVKLEGYRIDEIQGSQRTYNKPLKCLFVSCNETQAEGS